MHLSWYLEIGRLQLVEAQLVQVLNFNDRNRMPLTDPVHFVPHAKHKPLHPLLFVSRDSPFCRTCNAVNFPGWPGPGCQSAGCLLPLLDIDSGPRQLGTQNKGEMCKSGCDPAKLLSSTLPNRSLCISLSLWHMRHASKFWKN